MKNIIISIVVCLTLLLTAWSISADVNQMTESEASELLGIFTALNQNASAYKPTAFRKMLTEANYFSQQLKLAGSGSIQIVDVEKMHIGLPAFSVIKNSHFDSPVQQTRQGHIAAAGYIETTNFTFYFHNGNLWSVRNREKHMERFDLYPDWHKTPSLIDSNGAYQMATQWLAAINVNIWILEKKYSSQMKVEQAFFWDPPGTTNKAMLPIFNLTWGNGSKTEYPVQVRVFGITKELMELRVFDRSLSSRPPLIVSTVAEFEKYIKAQTNLPVMHLQQPKAAPISVVDTNALSPSLPTNIPTR